MSGPFGSQHWMYASGQFYDHTIDQSLKLDDASGGYLTISSASPTATNRKKVTISCWVKRAGISVSGVNTVFWSTVNGLMLQFFTADNIYIYDNNAGGWQSTVTNGGRVFRDPTAWYHLALIIDTTQSTSANRAKFYINGELQTLNSYPGLNTDITWHDGSTMRIGSVGDTQDLTGYIAEFISIDGQDTSISDFGETKNGVWVPKDVSGLALGDAGFYLKFDNSADIGNDSGSNNIDFTASNLVASDVVPDSPTNNFATLNFLDSRTSEGWKEGGLNWLASSSGYTAHSTMVIPEISDSDTYYAEVRVNAAGYAWGISPVTLTGANNSTTRTGMYTLYHNGRRYNGTTAQGSGNNEYANVSVGDIFGIKAGNGEIRFFQNGTDRGAAFTGLSGSYKFGCWAVGAAGTGITWNFGQDSTFHGQESAGTTTDQNGFGLFNGSEAANNISLCAANIAEPAIGPNSGVNEQADDYFETVLYAGTGSTQSITGIFQPDFVWIKARDGAGSGRQHMLFDSIRGATKVLRSHLTNDEVTVSTSLTSFNSDGFTIGSDSDVNTNSENFVAWNWKAGGTAVSNSDGSVSSTVSADTDAGFSIVQYEGLASGTQTVGHGLNSAPEYIIFKNKDDTSSWVVYSEPVGTSGFLILNSTGYKNTSDVTNTFNSTAPTASVFTVGTNNAVGGNGETIIAYCFHSVEGYCKVGSYTGNGSSDGTFVYTGFRPAWVLWKRYDGGTNGWFLMDSKRDTENVTNTFLRPNATAQEATAANSIADFLSNGFKLRGTGGDVNTNTATYLYLAFAEAPFKYANAR